MKMKNGGCGRRHSITSQVWEDSEETEMCRTDIDLLYAASRPDKKRGTREKGISGPYSSRPVKRRREEEEVSRSYDFLYSSSRSVKTIREEELGNSRSSQRRSSTSSDISLYGHDSSNRRRRSEYSSSKDNRRRDISSKSYDGETSRRRRRRRRKETNSRGEVINYSLSLSIERRRREERRQDVSLDSRSSNKRRKREDSSSKSHICRDDSPDSCSDQSVITQDDINIPVGSSNMCEDVSSKFYEDEINAEPTPVVSFPSFVDDGLVAEILTRLPVKSLYRFKSVCKRWRSLITHDPHFIHLHSTRSISRPKLLCMAPPDPRDEEKSKTLPQCILSANLSLKTTVSGEGEEPQVIIHNIKKTTDDKWFHYDFVLGPVSGLVCFIHCGTAAARIYNVSTRQITPWIKSTLLAEEKDKFESEDNPIKIVSNLLPIYQMGFDPEKKEHKVFCFWRLSATDGTFREGNACDAPGYASWEALTVGRDTKWRRISVTPDENNVIKMNEVLPPHHREINMIPVNANGTIYWRIKGMSSEYELMYPKRVSDTEFSPSDPDVIIAFDVGSEKFRVIPIPRFILDEPREKMFDRPIAMLVLGGRITLVYQMSDFVLKLWMLDDGVEKKLENCQGRGSSNWSAETITLPFEFDTRFCNFHGVPASADIILISMFKEIGDTISTPKVAYLFSYDRKTKASWDGEIDRAFSVPLHLSRSLFTTFTESLIPVQPPQDG
ncbi:hypothetical protein MKW94_029404 [Papaver nudicaule]|uniref:F-box domain-containing protein n=1 Tax=Papaver nudicaule TaxID=74823 RepID=A0AA41VXY4_PAPNU|nr:hypothetical protein [Papaver nudicaule]